MAALPLIVFDGNETLLDLGAMEPTFLSPAYSIPLPTRVPLNSEGYFQHCPTDLATN